MNPDHLAGGGAPLNCKVPLVEFLGMEKMYQCLELASCILMLACPHSYIHLSEVNLSLHKTKAPVLQNVVSKRLHGLAHEMRDIL